MGAHYSAVYHVCARGMSYCPNIASPLLPPSLPPPTGNRQSTEVHKISQRRRARASSGARNPIENLLLSPSAVAVAVLLPIRRFIKPGQVSRFPNHCTWRDTLMSSLFLDVNAISNLPPEGMERIFSNQNFT